MSATWNPVLDDLIKDTVKRVARMERGRYSGPFDMDEFLQEARLKVWRRLPVFDELLGSMDAFVWGIIANCALELRRRWNRWASREECWTEEHEQERQFVELGSSPLVSPEHNARTARMERLHRRLASKTFKALEGLPASLCRESHWPSEEYGRLLCELDVDKDSPKGLCAFFEIDRNTYNRAQNTIYGEQTKILDLPEFAALTELARAGHQWPTIHYSPEANDLAFVSTTRGESGLLGHASSIVTARGAGVCRVLETYPWGNVMFIDGDGPKATLVIQGRLNDNRDGRVTYGRHWKEVRQMVPAYRRMFEGIRK